MRQINTKRPLIARVRTAYILATGLIIVGLASAISFSQGGGTNTENADLANIRTQVSRAKRDMRTLSIAIESFHIDHNAYPAGRKLKDVWNSVEDLEGAGIAHLRTVEPGRPGLTGTDGHQGLSTPIGYIARAVLNDPFSPLTPKNPYIYHVGDRDRYGSKMWYWILVSAGPDGDYDFDPTQPFDESRAEFLTSVTYDPSNGTVSNGDLMRTEKGIMYPTFYE